MTEENKSNIPWSWLRKVIGSYAIAWLAIFIFVYICENKLHEIEAPLESIKSDNISVRLKWVFTAHTAAGPGVAYDKGFFKDENINITLNPGGFELDPITLVANGSDDFGIKGADDILIARSKGVPIVAIAVDYQVNPVAFMSLKEKGITKPQDFVGKRIGVKHGQNVYTFYKAMLKKLNINEASITEIPVKFDVSPLLTGAIEVFPGYATFEPAIFKNKNIEVNIILANDYGVPSYGNVVFTTEQMIQDNPELVLRFLRAYIKGWQWAIQNPETTANIMARLNENFSQDIQYDMLNLTIPYIQPSNAFKIGLMTEKGWQETQQIMLEENILKKPVDINAAFTTKFLDQIYSENE